MKIQYPPLTNNINKTNAKHCFQCVHQFFFLGWIYWKYIYLSMIFPLLLVVIFSNKKKFCDDYRKKYAYLFISTAGVIDTELKKTNAIVFTYSLIIGCNCACVYVTYSNGMWIDCNSRISDMIILSQYQQQKAASKWANRMLYEHLIYKFPIFILMYKNKIVLH